LRIKPAKQLAADRFVTPLGQPPAALVAASSVKTERDIVKASHHGIVELDTKG
jgi:hypothetical protein